MERLEKFAKTTHDVNSALKERDLFRDVALTGPVTLTEALRMNMSSLTETPVTIGAPSTAWWWFVEDFYRPIGRHDMLKLLPREDEMDPNIDRCFKMPPLGPPEGRRTLTECWESFGYTALRKERRSGRLAEKRAFSSGQEVPSAPGADWLELPKEFLKTQKNAVEICKDGSIVAQLDKLLSDLDVTPDTATIMPPKFVRYQTIHPLTEMMLEQAKNDDRMEISGSDQQSQELSHPFSSHCLSIGPDDEIVAEILKLQDNLFEQMVTNRVTARRLSKAALRNSRKEKKEALVREQKENEIVKCMKIIEAHERKMKEKRATEKAESQHLVETPPPPPSAVKRRTRDEKSSRPVPKDIHELKPVQTKLAGSPLVSSSPAETNNQPPVEADELEAKSCDICGLSDSVSDLLVCEHCGVAVHQRCYSSTETPVSESSTWYCLPCRIYHERQRGLPLKSTAPRSGGAFSVECKICPNSGGAFEKTTDRKWIHSICQLAMTEGNRTGSIQVRRRCILCGKAKGKVLPCSCKNCIHFLHPSCAKEQGNLVIKHKKRKNDTDVLVVESMTCGQCKIVEPKPAATGASSTMSELEAKEVKSLGSGMSKKRKISIKSENTLNEDDAISIDEIQQSVCMSTRSKVKTTNTDESQLFTVPETKATKHNKKPSSSNISPNSKKIKKNRKGHSSTAGGKHMQGSLTREAKSELQPLVEKKKVRITRSRK